MANDPLSIFGGLMRSCIRDDYAEDKKVLREGFVVMVLGIASSMVTTYILATLGILV